ncbi:MAG: thiamine biosynthesis protein ApbE [Anaerolineaceae bacterium]|nr:thiamine biosynthesis protein ApbE [Anaerolineaceae bacterium]
MLHSLEFRAMGCSATIQLQGPTEASHVLDQVPEQIAKIEAQLTRFQPDSNLMQFNAKAGEWIEVSHMLYENVLAAKQAARITNGRYNPLVLPAMVVNGYDRSFEQMHNVETQLAVEIPDWRNIEIKARTRQIRIPVGTAIDLGGIGKGWTAEYIADQLAEIGPCLVDFGGDIVARGAPDGYSGWPIDIEDPNTGEIFATVTLQDSAIATSGIDYRRWQNANGDLFHHIINPDTGQPARTDVFSATVIHPHAPTAEAYAKAVLIQGAQSGLSWLSQQWHGCGLTFSQEGAVLSTSNFEQYIQGRIFTS